ncbi:MAG: hypothetical protein HDR02_14985 [Lachnospiraceae bacterium]|nr:hypothetical protein [Lachnospiraceae bacterium]
MIKGHAIIELKNTVTGETQRVEHDNMITNGLKYCLTPWLGKYSFANTKNAQYQTTVNANNESRKTNNASIMNHLLGGIFAFQNTLEENVENVTFPLNNPLTGKASYDTYSGMDSYRGSYNEGESGLQEDGSYKHVWDFTTNQANGQISALALTTYKGGICGCGFKDWNPTTEPNISESPFIELGQIAINTEDSSTMSAFVDVTHNVIYYSTDRYNTQYHPSYTDRHLSNNKKLILKKKKFPLNQISPFYDYYNQYIEEEIELTVPDEFATYVGTNSVFNEMTDNYLYIYKEVTIPPGGSCDIWRIKKTDMSSDIISVINTTLYNLKIENQRICFTGCYCFLFGGGPKGEGYIYRINLDNNDITLVKDPEPEYYTQFKFIVINGYIYIGNSNGYNKIFCINPETLEIKYHPIFIWNNGYGIEFKSIERIAPNIFLWMKKGNVQYDYATVNIMANTLMTINNLSSPITKTAAQTMKITYTIQETE